MSQTPRMDDTLFELRAAEMEYDQDFIAEARRARISEEDKDTGYGLMVKDLRDALAAARDAEAFERGARLIESNARQVAEAERDALIKDQANSTVEIAAVQARADKADAENTRLKATADTLRAALEHHLWCRVCAEIGCEACGPDCTARAALQATEPKRGAQTVEAKP